MPVVKLVLHAGINKQITPTLNEGGYSDGNLVRFRDHQPQPVGGWVKAYYNATIGICRALHAWVPLSGGSILAAATSQKLYLYINTNSTSPLSPSVVFADITPPTGVLLGGTANGINSLWSVDNWGEELVACKRGGALLNWKPASTSSTPAALIVASSSPQFNSIPLYNNSILVGLPERHLISFGSESSGQLDPMLIRWSDTENYSVWLAAATNAAGSFRISGGTQIMRAIAGQGEILVWTDAVLYSMRFQGAPYIYGFYQMGHACGLIAPNACAILNGVAFWMGYNRFLTYAGQVQTLHCDVWDAVFRNMNTTMSWKFFAGVNSGFGEVWFFYVSAAATEIDSVAVFDTEGQTWWTGQLSRTAWEDVGAFPVPIGVGSDGFLYNHETGADADGLPMNSYVQSGFFDVGDGEQFSHIDQIIPDFGDQVGPVMVTVSAQQYPNGATVTKGPFTMTTTTKFLSPRLRGRQLALRFASGADNAFWKLGALRARVVADGRH